MPPRRVQGPAGIVHEFPADATDDEIRDALEAESPAPDKQPVAVSGSAFGATTPAGLLAAALPDGAVDNAIGAIKGLGSTVTGLGQKAYDYIPGVKQASDAVQRLAFGDVNPEMMAGAQAGVLQPTNAAQATGKTAEQIAEFFLPTAEAGVLAKVPGLAKMPGLVRRGVAAAQAAGQTAAQGGGGVESSASGLLSAAVPGGPAMKAAAGVMERSAVQTMADSLRATKDKWKDASVKLAPEMLQRGIGGTFYQMRTLARKTADEVGKNLGLAYKAAAAAGQTVPGDIIRGNIQLASDALHVPNQAGKLIPIPGHEEAIAKLAKLDEFVGQLGPDIPVDKAATVKQAWDDIVDTAGLFGNKATASASEKAQAWSFREAANAFRDKLNTNPNVAALNKEFGFWADLRNVLNATKLRKTGQTGGLFRAGATATGMGVGALTGDSAGDRAQNAVFYGIAGNQMTKLLQSPWWMSKASAPMKQMLADALASGSAEKVASTTKRILTAAPAQVRAQFSE